MKPTVEPVERLNAIDLDALNHELAPLQASELVRWAYLSFGDGLVMSSSFGVDSAVMLHLATQVAPKIPVVFIDTGYLFPETYKFADRLAQRLNLNLKVVSPILTPARQEALYGRLWEGDDTAVSRYNLINKVEPMQRALRELQATAWIAGLRANQTQVRSSLRSVEVSDGSFKVHPLLRWSRADIDAYITRHGLPYHPLREHGYRSIGDVHSTRPVGPGAPERSGRRLGPHSECGLHLPRNNQAAA